ncbi:MAG: acyl transferase [Saprospiraceae bacterium]
MIEPKTLELLRKYVLGSCDQIEKNKIEYLISNNQQTKIEFERLKLFYFKDRRLDFKSEIIELDKSKFDELTIRIFHYQAAHNSVYKSFLEKINCKISEVNNLQDIRFLPIELYKTNEIKSGEWTEQLIFLSSGTSHSLRSKHYVADPNWYEQISWEIFKEQVLDKLEYNSSRIKLLGLLPGYNENLSSSLMYMLKAFSKKINGDVQDLLFSDFVRLKAAIEEHIKQEYQVILFGVSFALLDFAEKFQIDSTFLNIIETGGMKTDSRSFSKQEIIARLYHGFPHSKIISEYGMTELLSQAYAMDGINYLLPSSMKIMLTEIEDPCTYLGVNRRGRINIIDLSNIDTCCFIQTGDAGIFSSDGSFQVLGRIQDEELRGCNLNYEL